jgi:hypothetical protein
MPTPAFRINADCYLSTLAPLYGEVIALDEPQALYRVHGRNRYVMMGVGEKAERHLELYARRCDLLAEHASRLGLDVQPSRWVEGNWHHEQLRRVSTVARDVVALAPEGSRLLLLDDGQWGDGHAGTPAFPGRATLPFLESDGVYHGRPASDEHALSELERMRAQHDVDLLLVLQPGFWWLEHYTGFAARVRSFPCVAENDLLLAFDLRAEPAA